MNFKNSQSTFIKSFIVLLFITLPVSYLYYNDDIKRYEAAASNKIKLLPPTDYEISVWEKEHTRLEIEAKQREIYCLKQNIEIPDNNDDPIFDHFMNYPDGHNPPYYQIQKLLDNTYKKREVLLINSFFVSFTAALFITMIRNTKKKDITL